MFKTFFLSEISYSLKRPMVYIFLGLMTLFTFGGTVSDVIQIGGSMGSMYKNSPHIITIYTTILTLFGLLIATAFFNNAALKDYSNQFNEILFSSPLSKAGYFFGRFCSALILATIPMLGVFLGVILGAIVAPIFGWVDADQFGKFYVETFINNYFIFILPNMFFAGAIIFSLATKWKSTVISFVGCLVIIIGYLISGSLISDLENETVGALADMFGIRAYSVYTKYFTSNELNTMSPQFSGLLLFNRIIWIGMGTVILLGTYINFSFRLKNKRVKKVKKNTTQKSTIISPPTVTPYFTSKTSWLQFKSLFWTNTRSIIKSATFKILFLFCAMILLGNLIGGFEYYGLRSYPVTYKIIDLINGNAGIFVAIILVFFSGELVWRDRNFKINEVIDATPHASIISLGAKTLSLISVAVLLHLFLIVCGILYQIICGFSRIELDVYFLDFMYSSIVLYTVLSAVLIWIQVLVTNKYIGYFISIIVIFIWGIILSVFDIQSNMLVIGAGPFIKYSDMNSFGPALRGANWFNLYWLLFALLSVLTAGALWNRGLNRSLIERVATAKKQVSKSFRIITLSCFLAWMTVAGYIYYNTQVLNKNNSSKELKQLSADYESIYGKYKNTIQPKITDIKYNIDIFPNQRDVFVKSKIKITNESKSSIDTLYFTVDNHWEPVFHIPNANLVHRDNILGYIMYKLNDSLEPEETISIDIDTKYVTRGFNNSAENMSIVRNGTFLNNTQILPTIGYSADRELTSKYDRKKYGLKPRNGMPELQEDCGDKCNTNYLTQGTSDFIPVETVISTSKDQTAIAPGTLVKKWESDDRNYFHYVVDHISQNFYSFMSARYVVARRTWNEVDIEIYYDEKHPQNIDMMLDAVERSLDYYTEHFGPYYHKQCRIVEFPRYADFAQAFPGTMPYSEALGFVINLEDSDQNNVVDAVIAHEVAHQWWAHQVIGATMQGATMLSESFSEYSSLMTLKRLAKSPMKMRKFLKYNHDRYLSGRSTEINKELPLYKVENQSHIHYGKGSIILYALQEYIGEEKLNTALRNFLEEYKYKKPPYPTSLDFIRHLDAQVADSLKYLINDWFMDIILYDNRITKASYTKLADDKYSVTMEIESYKLKADSIGVETNVAMDDWIDIGFFSDDAEEDLLFEQRVKIDQNKMSFTFELDFLPVKAAIDPKWLLIDRIFNDNVMRVQETSEPSLN